MKGHAMQGYTPVELDIRRDRAEVENALHDALAPGGPVAELIITADLEVTTADGVSVLAIRFGDDGADGAAAVVLLAKALGTEAVHRNGIWIAMRDFGTVRIEATFASYARIDALLTECRAEAARRAARTAVAA